MEDLRGNPVSTRSAAALAAAERALWRLMSFYGAPGGDIDAAAAADPGWCLPPVMRAGFLLSLTEPAVLPQAREAIAAAERLAAGTGNHPAATDRERAHLAAVSALAAGDWHGACRRWQAVLQRHPRDALALQWAHLFDFYRGDAASLRHRVEQVLPAWRADDPLQPYLLGLHAFGLEETGRYAEAEATGRRALAGGSRVPWAIHAVAHVMEMQGRYAEGGDWMAHWQPVWAADNGFAGHLGWHGGLFALEALDGAAALRQFDAHLAADPAQITLQRLDAAALLWRMDLLGLEGTGPRWAALASGWDLPDEAAGRYPFNDLHALLALIGIGDLAHAEAWVEQVARGARAGGGGGDGGGGGGGTSSSGSDDGTRGSDNGGFGNHGSTVDGNRAVAREVGVPLMRGVLAFAKGRPDDAVAWLQPARAVAHRFGGSHAQRDLIDQTLMAAAAGARDRSAGRALLDQRRRAKPDTPLTAHWARRLERR